MSQKEANTQEISDAALERAGVFGIDSEGKKHLFDSTREQVIVRNGDSVTHIEQLAREQVTDWIEFVATKRGWAGEGPWWTVDTLAEADRRRRVVNAAITDDQDDSTDETRAEPDPADTAVELTDDEQRAVAALEDVIAIEDIAPGMVEVVTIRESHTVDVRHSRCDCEDMEYNLSNDSRCKHIHAARLAIDQVGGPVVRALVDDLDTRPEPHCSICASDGLDCFEQFETPEVAN